jgi:acetyl esterase
VLDHAAVEGPFYEEYAARYHEFAGATGVGAEHKAGIQYIWETYVPDVARRGEQDASPLRAESLAGAAPAVVIVAEHDILRGETNDYAERLQQEGVPVESHEYAGQVHGFFHMLGAMDDARDAVDKSAAALRAAFA